MRPSLLLVLGTLLVSTPSAQSAPGWASHGGSVTGGAGGRTITVSNTDSLVSLVASAERLVIFVQGTHSATLDFASNKTVIGLPGARINGSIEIQGPTNARVTNVILRNLIVRGAGCADINGPDAINVQGATRLWLDHLDIADGVDGNLDITNGADLITVSNTRFSYTRAGNHCFSNLVGSSDSRTTDRGLLRITWVGNWWAEGVVERMPRVRFGRNHVVNNLFSSAGNNHCIRAGREADILVERNVFAGVRTPVDLFDATALVTMRDNLFTSGTGTTGRSGQGTSFTPPYSMTLLPTDQVEASVRARAGATLPDLRNIPSRVESIDRTQHGRLRVGVRPGMIEVGSQAAEVVRFDILQANGRVIAQGLEVEPGAMRSLPTDRGVVLVHDRGTQEVRRIVVP